MISNRVQKIIVLYFHQFFIYALSLINYFVIGSRKKIINNVVCSFNQIRPKIH